MKVPDEVRKTVGFVAYESVVNGDIVPVGTFFFVGHDPIEGETTTRRMYAVTAQHVIDGLRSKGRNDLTLRMNSKAPDAPLITVTTDLDDWFRHPSDDSIDVAILEMGIPHNADHLVIPFGMCVTPNVMAQSEVALGDEIFISGLFRHHFGKLRNIPIVRTGNLAVLGEERVQTKSFGEIDAILIEARSIGGLSGSPVFLNLGSVRVIDGGLQLAGGGSPNISLLGLIHGHFDSIVDDSANDEIAVTEKINAGVAIVVPISKVREVIEAYEANHATGADGK